MVDTQERVVLLKEELKKAFQNVMSITIVANFLSKVYVF